MKRLVFHIDVNSAFLSWEAAHRLHHLGGRMDLREIPSAVAGDVAMRHGIVLAKSIPAQKYGIHTGEVIWQAKQKCPQLLLVPPNYSLYEKASRALMEILREYTPDVEPYSIDEAFLDMTAIWKCREDPQAAAEEIRGRICRELGFTVNIGISDSKLLAKMASGLKKPNLVHTLFPEEIQYKMWPLPVGKLFFVGRATAKKLHSLGIRTIGELAQSDPTVLKYHLKKHGEVIWGFANGKDMSGVESEAPPNKGYGNSTTVAFDVTEAAVAKMVLLALSETVSARLRRHNVKAEVICVAVKDSSLCYTSHQMTLKSATDITAEIHAAASRLFDELWNGNPIRHLGIHTSRLRDGGTYRQTDMFDRTDYGKLEKMDETVDLIRSRYGIDAVKRAVFLKTPVDHMSGGISREKRTVDYSRQKIE